MSIVKFEHMGQLAEHLTGIVEHMEGGDAIHNALEKIGEHLEKKAKEKIGNYQWGWAKLEQSTEEAKARMGYPTNAPLLASGDLRESIGHEVEDHSVIIGAKDEVMKYHEFGTEHIPPRPVFQSLAAENNEFIQHEAQKAMASSMKGKK
jgi:phage gpG-like protein